MSQCVLIWSTAYPVYRFLLDTTWGSGRVSWTQILASNTLSLRDGCFSNRTRHWDAAVGRQANTEGERYSPNQVCHAGAHHHHVNSLVHHDLIKTHNKSFSKPVSRFIYFFFHLGLLWSILVWLHGELGSQSQHPSGNFVTTLAGGINGSSLSNS